MISRRLALGALIALAAAATVLADPAPPSLSALVAGPQRSAANKARDPWRHPLESLTFWGLKPTQTVIEIDPGGGYWTEIIAPYLAAGGGHYVAGMSDPASSDNAKKGHDAFAAKFADAKLYGPIDYAVFSSAGGLIAPAGSADLIMISRNVHNLMWVPGGLDRSLASFYAALKPGGVLAVEEHRADPRPMVTDARDGYVSEASVVAAAAKAGFVLDARSEINANPKDTKDHPFGVWTLPPTLRSAPEGQPANPAFDHTKYIAIGESDRMTLRFRKPA